ncbi:MAG TPA: hypothetical protein EYH22_02715 [Candidatus Nanopusillus sp.]|nr:hypothetical protein [Candidatus Nanopusillus sp.]
MADEEGILDIKTEEKTEEKNEEVDTMANVKDIVYTDENMKRATNPKEEYELLNGLFQGNYAFEERKTLRDVKLAKLIDML